MRHRLGSSYSGDQLMAKIDPYTLRRKPRVQIDRTFTDPVNPDVEVTLCLRRLSAMEHISAIDTSQEMVRKYVTGYGIPGRPGYIEPELLPAVDGQPVFISESTAQVAAFLYRAQTVPDSERYSFEELVSFMVSDAFCAGFSEAVTDITSEEEVNSDPLA